MAKNGARNILACNRVDLCLLILGSAIVGFLRRVLIHLDRELTRRDCARIRHVVEHGRDVLSPARLRHRTELGIRMIRIDDLIVVRICARELGGIVHCLRRRFRIIENILIDVGSRRAVYRHPRGIVNETVREAAILIDVLEPDHIIAGHRCRSRIPVALRIARYAVIGLVEVLHRLRDNLGRGNRPLCCDCVGICRRHRFEVALGYRCAELIVRERARRPVLRSRDDVVCDMVRLRLVRGTVCTRRITGKMPVLTRHREIDIVLVLIDDPRIGAACCRLCDKRLAVFEGKGTRTVIDLCRIGDRAVAFAHLKARFLDQAAVDRTLAVDGIVDLVVVLLRCIDDRLKQRVDVLITDIVLGSVARVRIFGKARTRTASIGTRCRPRRQHRRVLRLQLVRRNAVFIEDGCGNGVPRRRARNARDAARLVRSSAVIDLIHRTHRESDRASLDRTCVVVARAVLCQRQRILIRRGCARIEDVVVRICVRATVKGDIVCDILRLLPLIRIVPCHIRTRIGRRRGVRARRVSRDPP